MRNCLVWKVAGLSFASFVLAVCCHGQEPVALPSALPPVTAVAAAPAAGSPPSLPMKFTTTAGFSETDKDARQPNVTTRPVADQHHFWDHQNAALFSWVAASRALDYSSTLNMRRRGRQEILLSNDVVDNHAAFAAIEAGGFAVSIGASYLFHRYHHHRLERWTSIVHASLATSGAIRNYCLKTAHPSATP